MHKHIIVSGEFVEAVEKVRRQIQGHEPERAISWNEALLILASMGYREYEGEWPPDSGAGQWGKGRLKKLEHE